jgi:putative two-component system response regulator
MAGEDIPLEGRITAVADVFDALSSRRPYKPAFPIDKCFEILEQGRGSQFDSSVLDAFFAVRSEIVATQIEYAEVS